MRIYVKTMMGKIIFVSEVGDSDTIERAIVSEVEVRDIEPGFMFGEGQLEGKMTSSDDAVGKEPTSSPVLRLRGGGKKRKKKHYTTPKKVTHKKKKQKLSILKCYNVDANGRVQRLRKQCPQPGCGAGVFMAAMKDRNYCGRCGYTEFHNKKKATVDDGPSYNVGSKKKATGDNGPSCVG